MNFRLTLGLAILLAVLAGAWYVATQHASTTTTTAGKAAFTTALDIKTIALARGATPVLTLERQSKDVWRLTAPVNAAVDSYNVSPITDALQTVPYKEKFAAEDSGSRSLSGTGLDAPRQTVTFTTQGGASHKLELGKRSATGGIYAMLDGDKNNFYILDTAWLDALDKDPSEMRSKTLADLGDATITGVTLAQPKQTIAADKHGEAWTITQPIPARGDATTLNSLIDAVKNLQVQSFSDMTSSDPATGLNPPRVTLTVRGISAAGAAAAATSPATTQPGALLTLRFGNYADLAKRTVYVATQNSDEAYIVDADAFRKADGDLTTLRDATILPGDPTAASAVTIQRNGQTIQLTRGANGDWKISAPLNVPADGIAVSEMLSAIKTLRANKFVDGAGDRKSIGLDPAQITITLSYAGQPKQDTLLIGKPETAEPLTPVQQSGEASVEMVQNGDLQKVLPTLLALRDKTVEPIDESAVTRIELSPDLVLQKGKVWMLTDHGKTVIADSGKISALVEELAPLRAKRWLAMTKPSGTPDRLVQVTVNSPIAASQAATQSEGPPAMESAARVIAFYNLNDSKTVRAVLQPIGGGDAWTFAPTDALVNLLLHPDFKAAATTAPAMVPTTAPH
jgi:hypothetical protein